MTVQTRLDPDRIREVLALAESATQADGAAPLAEHVLLRLTGDRAVDGSHLLVHGPDGHLTGYGYLDRADPANGGDVELVVHPGQRRQGIGRALVEAAHAEAARTGTGPVRFWAHGDHPSAAALAVDFGLTRSRILWQLRRSLRTELPEPALPAGVSLRAFRPGLDDDAWLDVNRRAFATHPEQGRWTVEDLRVRFAEPWFDPAGFLLAVDEGTDRLLGFHWTKVHGQDGAHGREPIGEVYVLGVAPQAHGLGLGRALTLAGLRHLRDDRGLGRVMLYVDESNTPAMALYQKLGFAHWTPHVQYT